jgi:uncharacterized protein YdiU (UPF0061 family)
MADTLPLAVAPPRLRLAFDNSYARLPERCFARLPPVPVAAPRLLALNAPLAAALGLDTAALAAPEGVAMLAGNLLPDGAEPIALAYAGHQFGQFVPQLGDGRAILLGELVTPEGERRDLQLKGSGPTPFSRRGDGRAAVGPMLREYLVSEAMAALGIPTTRTLAVVATGEAVRRETILPGAVLARIAASHLRVGTFQYFAARGDLEALRRLVDYALARHPPQDGGGTEPARALLAAVVARQASLVAQWLLVGFVHGVMNTDNMSIAGETIDYGPCAFLDAYDPAAVWSAIDHAGRYAYGQQPRVALWNLARLAEALLPLLAPAEADALAVAEAELERFGALFEGAYRAGLCRKLGLAESADGFALAQDLLRLMAEQGADFTGVFRALCDAAERPEAAGAVAAWFADPAGCDAWAARWRALLDPARVPAMRRANPAFVPRNHLVEATLAAAVERDDLSPFRRLDAVLARPFDDQPDAADLALPPRPEERVLATFCGT